MKRGFFVLLSILIMTLCGCAAEETRSELPTEDRIEPYILSEEQEQILGAFGMENTARLFSFQASETTAAVTVRVYRLTEENTWMRIGEGQMSLEGEYASDTPLSGTIALEMQEQYVLDLHINAAGSLAFSSEEIILEEEPDFHIAKSPEEPLDIEQNQETPIAILAYGGEGGIPAYTLEDYEHPEILEGVALVQAVTVEFTEQ